MKDPNKIILCCGGKTCPEMSLTKDKQIQIKDDNNNIVVMKIEQAKLISGALDSLLK